MHPLIRALRRHKLPVMLIVAEIALTCAIVANTLYLTNSYVRSVAVDPGVDSEHVAWLVSSGGDPTAATAAEDIDALKRIVGVRAAASLSALPLTNNGAYHFTVKPSETAQSTPSTGTKANFYFGTPGALGALGLTLIGGRDFSHSEYVPYALFGGAPAPSSVIITQSLAARLWPGQSAVGKPLELSLGSHNTAIIVGVVRQLLAPALHHDPQDADSILLPVTKVDGGVYALSFDQQHGTNILSQAQAALYRSDASRIITASHYYSDTVEDYFRGERAMIWLLAAISVGLLMLAVVGIVALSHYWVIQRRRSVAIRRALGASRRDILRYFQLENLLLVCVGGLIGAAGALGVNAILMSHFEVPRLPLAWLPVGILVLIAIGQCSVLGPALRASAQAPARAASAD